MSIKQLKVIKRDELAFKLAQYEADHAGSERLAELLYSGCEGWATISVSEMIEYINFNITDESFQDITGLEPGMQIAIGDELIDLCEEVNKDEE